MIVVMNYMMYLERKQFIIIYMIMILKAHILLNMKMIIFISII